MHSRQFPLVLRCWPCLVVCNSILSLKMKNWKILAQPLARWVAWQAVWDEAMELDRPIDWTLDFLELNDLICFNRIFENKLSKSERHFWPPSCSQFRQSTAMKRWRYTRKDKKVPVQLACIMHLFLFPAILSSMLFLEKEHVDTQCSIVHYNS